MVVFLLGKQSDYVDVDLENIKYFIKNVYKKHIIFN